MSFLIVAIVGEILDLKHRKRDLALASLIVSLITVVAIIFDVYDNIITRAITIFLMTQIGFKPRKVKNFIIEITFILGVTFLIGGVINSNINNIFEIIICGVLSVVALKKYNDYYKKKKWKLRNRYKLKFEIEDEIIQLEAFLDTGNFLTTNFKEEPVIIISKKVLQDKISKIIMDLLTKGEISDLDFNILRDIRAISYLVLNEKTKTIYGLKVRNIEIKNENCEIIRDAVITISENDMKEIEAIIGLSLLEGGIEDGNTINAETESQEIIC